MKSHKTVKSLITLSLAAISGLLYAESFDLRLIHMNDHHSRLFANDGISLSLAGESTRVRMGGFPAVASLIEQLSAQPGHSVKLHAGDAITGDLYYTLFRGEADAAMMNQVCFDVFALGNHEFDDGDQGLVNFLDHLASDPDCQTEVLAANVIPKLGRSPLAMNSLHDYFKPYSIKYYGDQAVGFIGIDIAMKTKNSSAPDDSTIFLDEVSTAQHYIDILQQQGVNKIVLVTHYQYQNDLAMAQALRGVDVIVGGDSHSLLGGDELRALGLNPEGPYPTRVQNADGDPVCVVQAWENALAVGELLVSFDPQGRVTACDGRTWLPLTDNFRRRNAEGQWQAVSGQQHSELVAAVAQAPNLVLVQEDAATAERLQHYTAQVDELKNQVIGESSNDLCLVRIPGESRSQICAPEATAQHGSDIVMLVAAAFLEMSPLAQVSIQNAGGVRIDVPKGPITLGTAYQLLPFSNTLVNMSMTGAEIRSALEDALDFSVIEGGSTGAYPYAAGLRFDVDLTQAKGQRVSNLQTKPKGETEWRTLAADEQLVVVTNDFIARGQDGYRTFGEIWRAGRAQNTYLDYAQSFVEYVRARGQVGSLPASEYSTASFKR